MINNNFFNKLCLLFATVILSFAAQTATAWARPPAINAIIFPEQLPLNAIGSGTIAFTDFDDDPLYVRFDVADGRYHQVIVPAELQQTQEDETIPFSLACTSYAQQITLSVTLFDKSGSRSASRPLVFVCGQPPQYNFDAALAKSQPVDARLQVRFFLLDDRETATAERATQGGSSPLRLPQPEVMAALREAIIPRLTGIWDQCGLGFELAGAWVVNPASVKVSNGTLASRLLLRKSGSQFISHSRAAGDALRQAVKQLAETVSTDKELRPVINVFVAGSRILAENEELLGSYVEGFAEGAWPNNYAVVRWGAPLQNVVPKQMIATLSHEIGHLLGLTHAGEDGIAGAASDPFNLMHGSGVTPQPRAHLVAGQCDLARRALAKLEKQLAAANGQGEPVALQTGGSHSPRLTWLSGCPDWICSKTAQLSVVADDFENLEDFGIASFAYSADGTNFKEIQLDRSYSDGFITQWDTQALANGRYLLRVVAIDKKGNQARLQVEVRVEN